MDKYKQEYLLDDIKELVEKEISSENDDYVKTTLKALKTADSIGFSTRDVYDVLLQLDINDFYKSTTENYNPKVWQDVYKKYARNYHLYIKLKILTSAEKKLLVLSFKKDESKYP